MHKEGPTFLGIGARKAGTTWLYKQLYKHPEIWMPPKKELHFFDRSSNYPSLNKLATSSPISRLIGSKPWERAKMKRDTEHLFKHLFRGNFSHARWYSRWTFGYYNEAWYRKLFCQAPSMRPRGEITPCYSILNKEDVARIRAVNPDMKIIYMIRDPIERAWSSVRYAVDNGKNINLNSDDEVIAALKHSGMMLRGDYERTLDNFLHCFDASQILVCFYDAVDSDPAGLLSDIAKFLDIDSLQNPAVYSTRRFNESSSREMTQNVRDYLVDIYWPMISRIAEAFGSYSVTWKDSIDPSRDQTKINYSNIDFRPAIHP